MKIRVTAIALMLLIASGQQHADAASSESEQLLQDSILSMLFKEDPGAARLGARAIRIMYPADQRMTDCIAERLLQLTATEPEQKWIRPVDGHIIMLGQLKNPRYRNVLTMVRERTTNEDIQSRVGEALAAIGKDEAEPYVPGSIDLALERASTAAHLAAAKKADRSTFALIKPEANFTDVISRIGAPDSISEWPVKGQKFVLHYQDLGIVLVTFSVSTVGQKRPQPPRMLVQFVAPEAVSVSAIYNGKNYAKAQIVGSVNGRALVQYFHANRRAISTDMDAMNVLVQRIIKSSHSARRYDEKMFVQTLAYLRASHDPRAMELIRQVAQIPGEDAITKHAVKIVRDEEARIASGRPRPTQVATTADTDDADDKFDDGDDDGADGKGKL